MVRVGNPAHHEIGPARVHCLPAADRRARSSLVVGDVDGSYKAAFAKIAALNAKNSFALAIIAGTWGPFSVHSRHARAAPETLTPAGNLFGSADVEDGRDGDLSDLLGNRISVPLPTYFALGRTALPPRVIERLVTGDGEVCENLFFLGKRTVIKTSEGVRIVALGGAQAADGGAEAAKDPYAPTYSIVDGRSLRGANTADILVTSEWPRNVLKGCKGAMPDLDSITQQDAIAELCVSLRPRYHFSTGPATFFERPPFFHPPLEDAESERSYQITRFISMAPFGNAQKAKWIYAFTIDPAAAHPVTIPDGTTASPFSLPKKRTAPPTEEGFSRYAQYSSAGAHHRSNGKRSKRQPPPGPDSCFFCLSNPNVETHLVTSIGDDAYMTTAKGPLTTSSTFISHGFNCPSHMLIIPLPHVATLASITESDSRRATVKEMRRFRARVYDMLKQRAEGRLGAVVWEVSRATGVHTHWQVLPIPANLVEKGLVEAAFKVEAENEGYPAFEKSQAASGEDGALKSPEAEEGFEADVEAMRSDVFRVWIWSPASGSSVMLLNLPLSDDFRFDLQFGRRVLAKLLGLEKRLQWRDCTQSEQEETADAEAWKDLFKEFDFALE